MPTDARGNLIDTRAPNHWALTSNAAIIRVNHWALVMPGPSGAIAVQLGPPSCGCTAVEMCVGKPFLSNTSWGRSRRATSNGLPSVNLPLHHPVLCNGADVSHDTPSELRPILYEQPQCQISRNAPCSPGSRYKYGSLQTIFTLFSLAHARKMMPGTGGFERETEGTKTVKG